MCGWGTLQFVVIHFEILHTLVVAADWLNTLGAMWLELSTKHHDRNIMPSFQTTGSLFEKMHKAICAFEQQHKYTYFTFACQKPNDHCCHCFEQIRS